MPCRDGTRAKITAAAEAAAAKAAEATRFAERRETARKEALRESFRAFLRGEVVQTSVSKLSEFYWAAIECTLDKGREKDPISHVNRNLVARCPQCGVEYNEHGFMIGYLASLASSRESGTPILFASGGEGMYPRCLSGICPNLSCSSKLATVEWKG